MLTKSDQRNNFLYRMYVYVNNRSLNIIAQMKVLSQVSQYAILF